MNNLTEYPQGLLLNPTSNENSTFFSLKKCQKFEHELSVVIPIM